MGKTELVREARAAAGRTGIVPLEARGSELEQPFAFGVVRQLLEPVVSEDSDRDDLFAGGAGPAARLFEPDERRSLGADVGFEALHSLYWLVVNIADQAPVLVLVDDCQWADRDSLRFLAYLAQRIEGLPVAMLLAGRPPDPAADEAGSLWAQLASRPVCGGAVPAAAEPAGRGGAGAGAAGRARPPRSSAARATRATGGNPLFLRELLRALDAAGVGAVGGGRERSAGGGPGRGQPFRPAPAGRARPGGDRAGASGRGARRRQRAARSPAGSRA